MGVRLITDSLIAEKDSEHKLTSQQLSELKTRVLEIIDQLMNNPNEKEEAYLELPGKTKLWDIRDWARHHKGSYDAVVHVGIGGSGLGAITIVRAIYGKHTELFSDERPRFYAIDNIDPFTIRYILESIDLESTMFHIVTKSGNTLETISVFSEIWRRLYSALGDKAGSRIVISTGESGFIKDLASSIDYCFEIPGHLAGRFSVLSPVGLVTAELMGIDSEGLLAGARDAIKGMKSIDAGNILDNPAASFALFNYLYATQKGCNMVVMFAYSDRLYDLADWFRQLWAESLGKEKSLDGEMVNVGQTPIKALGTTDQHSQVQLYFEGPYDKVIYMLKPMNYGCDLVVPHSLGDDKRIKYMQSKSLSQIYHAALDGTMQALTESDRPVGLFEIDQVDAYHLGYLFMAFMVATSIAGKLYNINAYNQPGVAKPKEETKKILLG